MGLSYYKEGKMPGFERLQNLITGENLTANERIFTALAPGMVLAVLLVGVIIAYSIRVQLKGHYLDHEMKLKKAGFVSPWFRQAFAWMIQPFWRGLLATQLPPAAVTMLSVLLSVGAGVALAAGRFALGGQLFLLSGILDWADGRLARAQNSASLKGAALDSVLDRYADAAIMFGLCWYYRESWMLMVCVAALAGSSFVPYVRAKGESLGISLDGGWLSRPPRVLILGFSIGLAPVLAALYFPTDPHPMHWLAVVGITIVAIGANLTAIFRLIDLLNFLDVEPKQPVTIAGKGSHIRAASSAVVATVSDAATFTFLISVVMFSPGIATAIGCVVGALVNFFINRIWAFSNTEASTRVQGMRYFVVWVTSTGLNAGGVVLVLMLPGILPLMAWAVVRIAVFLSWNYPLHKNYVFGTIKKAAAVVIAIFLVTMPALADDSPLRPQPMDAEAYTETWTTIADLEDGTYIQVQLSISNAGPGSERGKCRIVVVMPGLEAYTATKKVGRRDWSHEPRILRMGPCYAKSGDGTFEVDAPLFKGAVHLRLDKGLQPVVPPGGMVQGKDTSYMSTVLIPWAKVKADIEIPGYSAKKNIPGMAYADHSRTTTMPADLARRWARLRRLTATASVLALVRYPPGVGAADGWTWRQGEESPARLIGAEVVKSGEEWHVQVDGIEGIIRGEKLLYRDAPVESLGLFGEIVKSMVGNPVTYTYRVEGGLLEVTDVNEE